VRKALFLLLLIIPLNAIGESASTRAQEPAQRQSQISLQLSNKDVVDMIKAGLSNDIVIAKIKSSSNKFDTSPSALRELKTQGVPDDVILAMVQTPADRSSSAIPQPTNTSSASVTKLYLVKRIYIGEMGKSDDADRFRLLLAEMLSKKGFLMVDRKDVADAVLEGVLSTQLTQGTTKARVSVSLKSTGGESLWSGDFGVRMVFIPSRNRDSIKLRAEDVADALRDDWKKAAKKAGVKVD
jgi:hypothetical protein